MELLAAARELLLHRMYGGLQAALLLFLKLVVLLADGHRLVQRRILIWIRVLLGVLASAEVLRMLAHYLTLNDYLLVQADI